MSKVLTRSISPPFSFSPPGRPFSPPGGLDGTSLSPSTALDGSLDIVAHTPGAVPDCFPGSAFCSPPRGLDVFPSSAFVVPPGGLDVFPGSACWPPPRGLDAFPCSACWPPPRGLDVFPGATFCSPL